MVYINKQKYGECEWVVLENAASKELFLREPPPVLPEFHAWFENKFPKAKNALVKGLIFRVIVNSAKNEETSLSYNHLQNLLNLAKDEETKVKDVIDELSEVLGVAYSSYSHLLSYARNIEIEQNRALELQKEWNSFGAKKSNPRYSEAVSPITGESIHAPTYQKVIKESKECIKKHTEKKYKNSDDNLKEIISYLNARKIPEIIIDRIDQLLETKDENLDQINYSKLLSCRNNLIGNTAWKINEQGYRIFPIGGESLSTINREDRWQVTLQSDGFYEIDLKNAHFAIMAHMINGQEMLKLLAGGSIWPQLLAHLGLDSSFKDSLKECIYSILYGSGDDLQKILLIQNKDLRGQLKTAKENLGKKDKLVKTVEQRKEVNDECNKITSRIELESSAQDKEIYTKLVAHPAIKELLEGSRKLSKDIMTKGFFKDAFGIIHDVKEFKGKGKIMNTIMTSYEKKILMPVYKDAFETKSFEVIFDQHDGMTLYFPKKTSPEKKQKILTGLKNKVDDKCKKLGIESGMDIKGYA